MAITKHFQMRMSQRGIPFDIVELTQQFGEPKARANARPPR